MRTLIALLLFCTSASAQEFNWTFDDPFAWTIGGDASPSMDSAVRGTEAPSSYVHRINVVNRGGSATCIAPGVFVTCKHLFEGLRGYQVSIDGQAVAASVTLSPTHDVAIVTLSSEAAAESGPAGNFALSAPYMAECLAFGFGSETVHKGVISNDDTLSLYAGEGTIEQGDSGGAVFCDGVLVGVIRGKNPNNGKVCYFTPLKDVAALVAPFSPDAAVPAAPGADDKPVVTITSPETWVCVHCNSMLSRDWSGEPYRIDPVKDDDIEQKLRAQGWRGEWRGYPVVTWMGANGRLQVLQGDRVPAALTRSWKVTQ